MTMVLAENPSRDDVVCPSVATAKAQEEQGEDRGLVCDKEVVEEEKAWLEWLMCDNDEDAGLLLVEDASAALKSLEDMRKLNLEVELESRGVKCDRDFLHGFCTTCLLTCGNHGNGSVPNWLLKLRSSPLFVKPCLTCGAPTCLRHSSKFFRSMTTTTTVCCESCERLFTLHFVMDILTAPAAQRPLLLSRMLSLYDRTYLLFQHCASEGEELAGQLQESQVHLNHLDVGGRSAGVLSGAFGLAAAAAATVTAAGSAPLLLMTSLLLGGGSVAVQTTAHALHQHPNHPQQRANQILALHGMLHSILQVVQTLRDALVRDKVRTDSKYVVKLDKEEQGSNSPQPALVNGGCTLGRFSLAGVEWSTTTRGTTQMVADIGQAARVARLAGGVLSAATLLVEAHSLNQTLQAMRDGSPSDTALKLASIQCRFPSTIRLNAVCQGYLGTLVRRERELEVQSILWALSSCSSSSSKMSASTREELRLGVGDSAGVDDKNANSRSKEVITSSRLVPLRQRIEMFTKQRSDSFSSCCSVTSTTEGDHDDSSFSSLLEDDDDRTAAGKQSLQARIENHKSKQHVAK